MCFFYALNVLAPHLRPQGLRKGGCHQAQRRGQEVPEAGVATPQRGRLTRTIARGCLGIT